MEWSTKLPIGIVCKWMSGWKTLLRDVEIDADGRSSFILYSFDNITPANCLFIRGLRTMQPKRVFINFEAYISRIVCRKTIWSKGCALVVMTSLVWFFWWWRMAPRNKSCHNYVVWLSRINIHFHYSGKWIVIVRLRHVLIPPRCPNTWLD